ncbi:non-ribosomal peptide synthetase [Tengunoibacter tsumagoiensis]|uniref:Carrier domain-containing protein n=1 Tax=Tengunoibacter tsumagoiensis TaxID=2014871 RepID=A0A402A2Y4_9CHLR|nr:non-ribosomal peptide synthetase [Tengunoibacter tsumagoiensis]GCE13518.1 hypothetical protein KTT_33770 [Tengunoibacter tsumagoiensis]
MDQLDPSQLRQRLSLLKLDQTEQRSQRSPRTEIVKHAPRQEVALAPSQERLWFLDQLVPQSTAYHLPLLLRLTGPLNEDALERALQEVVQRHEALRTHFLLRADGRPAQVIVPELVLSLARRDVSTLPEPERIPTLRTCLEQELLRPFNLEQLPLIHATLFTVGEREHQLFLVLHHIIADAWSLRVLIQELSTLYQAYNAGKTSPFTEPPFQLGDYVSWLQDTASEQEQHLAYWQEQLTPPPTVLQLPFDRARPAVQGYKSAWITRRLPASLLDSLKKLAQKERITPYMLFLAVYAVLLSRYSNEKTLFIGTPIAQRNRSGLEQIIGFVANTLVLRADLSGDPSFRTFLGRIREMALQSFAHADAPFDKVVERVQPTRDPSYSPLFQVMFLFQNIVQLPIQAGELLIEVEGVEENGAQFDLTLAVSNDLCRFQYNTDLFDSSTITRLATHFEGLLQSVVDNPDHRLTALPFLTAEERYQLLVAWNTEPTPPSTLPWPGSEQSSEHCLHTLFERQVERTPTAVAATFEHRSLTYQELNQKANQLAHFLIRLGIGPEDLVGLAMERSLELLVGLFGILKAGAAYLPLDPLYPQERLAFLIQESQLSLLLTQPQVLPWLSEYNVNVIRLDPHEERFATECIDNPPTRTGPDNAVYVIFTSGSTGLPKGIVVRHGALVNHALAMVQAIELAPAERFLQFASISFDASAVQLFPTLISGATLVLHRAPNELSNYELWRLCQEQQVSVLDVPTAFWHQWIEDITTSNLSLPSSLRVFMTGGEMAAIDKVQTWAQATRRPATFISSYGPTEATITATIFTTTNAGEELAHRLVVPLGRPIANVQIYLLNDSMHPVPVGVIGEIFIGGAGLARGYLHHPALTAEQFVPHPFSTEPGARLYKTGDLARYLPDGTIEFQGRRDHQVKIRGFRIELGEIEAILRQHWTVQEAIVLARKETQGETRLIAYIVPKAHDQEMIKQLREKEPSLEGLDGATELSLEELQRYLLPLLRRFLKERLPNYMLPTAFVFLDRFPLTPNSKVDQRALPHPEVQTNSTDTYVAPRTAVEELLLKIWTQLLGGTQAGIHDSFFEHGGHSLLATQVISQVRRMFKIEVPLHTLFNAPTVADFAEALTTFETQPGQLLAIARRRKQLDSMSPAEIRARLQEKQRKG